MHRCPHCGHRLGFRDLVAMNEATFATCPQCAERYGWSVSGPGLLFMFAVAFAGVWALVQYAQAMPVIGFLLAIPALILVSGLIAFRSMKTIAR